MRRFPQYRFDSHTRQLDSDPAILIQERPLRPASSPLPQSPVTAPCPICEGSGLLISTDASGNRFAHECQCRLALRIERSLAHARIPRRYSECSILNYETAHSSAHTSLAEAALIARRFALAFPVETRGQGLLFTGAPGLGKTHLAVSILRQAITERGATGYFWEHKELLKSFGLSMTYEPQEQKTSFCGR